MTLESCSAHLLLDGDAAVEGPPRSDGRGSTTGDTRKKQARSITRDQNSGHTASTWSNEQLREIRGGGASAYVSF